MVKMRIGATVLISGDKAIQSYNWKLQRPLGSVQNAVEFLDKFECDEISLVIPMRSEIRHNEIHHTLKRLASIHSNSPVSIGGGLRNLSNFNKAAELPVERFIFSSEFIQRTTNVIEQAAKISGTQAIQCMLPMSVINNDYHIFHSAQNQFVPISKVCFSRISELADEIIIVDTRNEGNYDSFNFDFIREIPIEINRLVISGGTGIKTICRAKEAGLASVLLDNNAFYKEDHISGLKNANL